MFNELKKSNMFPVVVTAIILLITLPVLMTIGVIKKHRESFVRVTINLIEPNEPNDFTFAVPNETLSNFTCTCGNQIYLAGYYSSHRDELVNCAGCDRVWIIAGDSLEIVEPNDLPVPRMECKPIEPTELDTSEYITIGPNDPNIVDGYYTYDPNLYVTVGFYEPCTKMTITCEGGDEVVIDYGGDEVVVTGASEEGAKIFFEGMLKPLMDAYLESKNGNDE